MIGFAIGRILLVEAALLLLPMAVALGYGESPVPYLIPAALLVLCGGLLSFKKPQQASLFARDGLAVVALAWIAVSLFGALPFYISGSMESFVDCFFETVSGFTTTGATILTEVESLNRCWASTMAPGRCSGCARAFGLSPCARWPIPCWCGGSFGGCPGR